MCRIHRVPSPPELPSETLSQKKVGRADNAAKLVVCLPTVPQSLASVRKSTYVEHTDTYLSVGKFKVTLSLSYSFQDDQLRSIRPYPKKKKNRDLEDS